MDAGILAGRDAAAQQEIVAEAEELGERFGLSEQVDALKAAKSKDPKIKTMLQNEAIAVLLKGLNDATGNNGARMSATGPDSNLVELDALRGPDGQFVSPQDQDADGRTEHITHAKPTPPQNKPTKK